MIIIIDVIVVCLKLEYYSLYHFVRRLFTEHGDSSRNACNMLDSNLGRNIIYPDNLCGFPQSLRANLG